jgi:flagellar secretion chaperone FliS
MFGIASKRAASYASIGVDTGVSTADPHKLILMLFDGAVLAISSAAVALADEDTPRKGQNISKAIDIITNGLKVSLDMDSGGELAVRLAALYDYMVERLLYANLNNSRPALDEVAGLLRDLRDAWQQIGAKAPETV